jgi:hypothetical protein
LLPLETGADAEIANALRSSDLLHVGPREVRAA